MGKANKMFKLLIALTCVAAVSAYGDCPACSSQAGAQSNWCAYETSTSCGCNSCTVAANSFRILDCSLNACGDRRLAETTDLEEAAPATAQWGRRRRRRFFDCRRRRRRTPYPTPFPTPSPTCILGHKTCKFTYCTYKNGVTDIYSMGNNNGLATPGQEKFHCEKYGSGCKCVCDPSGRATRCALRHHHTSGYKKTFLHC